MSLYAIFHLNLAFSSIETGQRPEVIRRCYWPLLDLVENTGIPLGIELSGWTLQQIALLDQPWVERFRRLLGDGQCELVGSGWSQIIGPLVPYEVNRWNQSLGLTAYRQTLGVTPRIALVNEMAFSTSMVDVYAEAGYQGIIMDRDNVHLALELSHRASQAETPTHALGNGTWALPVLWSDSVLFQRLQRAVHGDIPVAEYLAYMRQRVARDGNLLPVYCNDAEIFDYRPGRFATESRLHPEGEWARLQRIFACLQQDLSLGWLRPDEALAAQAATTRPVSRHLTSARQPVPVKKQPKYNVNRWFVTGRDDLWLNTACHRIHRTLVRDNVEAAEPWRSLCEMWASDFRTHITPDRWEKVLETVADLGKCLGVSLPVAGGEGPAQTFGQSDDVTLPEDVQIVQDDEGILWTVKTPHLQITLNLRRGMAIKTLAFKSHGFQPIVGTLSQGYFDTIELAADFYSGGVLVEVPGERSRITDLEWVAPQIRQCGRELLISARIELNSGCLDKTVAIDIEKERVRLNYDFHGLERPLGVVRVGIMTLVPESLVPPVVLECANGGSIAERFKVNRNVDHGHAASAFVTSTAAFGATDGCLKVGDSQGHKLSLIWDPADCAAAPMLKHVQVGDRHLTRIAFSLCELDETSHNGGRLLPFSLTLSPMGMQE